MYKPPLIVRIIGIIAGADQPEIGCQEVYALLDELADLQAIGADTTSYLPLAHKHLQICADCREEFDALLAMIGGATASPAPPPAGV